MCECVCECEPFCVIVLVAMYIFTLSITVLDDCKDYEEKVMTYAARTL